MTASYTSAKNGQTDQAIHDYLDGNFHGTDEEEAGSNINVPGHNMRRAVAHVLRHLPDPVRQWILDGDRHFFYANGDTDRSRIIYGFCQPLSPRSPKLYFIYLSQELRWRSRLEDVHFVIAHEIAHSFLGVGGKDSEARVNAQCAAWGFPYRPENWK